MSSLLVVLCGLTLCVHLNTVSSDVRSRRAVPDTSYFRIKEGVAVAIPGLETTTDIISTTDVEGVTDWGDTEKVNKNIVNGIKKEGPNIFDNTYSEDSQLTSDSLLCQKPIDVECSIIDLHNGCGSISKLQSEHENTPHQKTTTSSTSTTYAPIVSEGPTKEPPSTSNKSNDLQPAVNNKDKDTSSHKGPFGFPISIPFPVVKIEPKLPKIPKLPGIFGR